ncbi:EEIG1/EHBP1 N-terminal domain [Macleaya cordata]|uniref:EEIG1/EHBP1 N-terminal domain n=1 Tax=Macleaya cordata TaxID=56857 RepID=A0A200QHJ9_MACCD|nr:EEIG1/EHBP1 N-terminal domain [Macleaya cordata]
MNKWKFWSAHATTRSFKLHLVIHDLKCLPTAGLTDISDDNLIVQIQWKGSRRVRGYLPKGVERNCTSKQSIQPDGSVNWDEGFNHDCKLKLMDSQSFRSWIINLEVHKLNQKSNSTASILAKAEVDIAKFASPSTICKRTICVPVNCSFRGTTAEATLTMELNFFDVQNKGSNRSVHPLAQTIILPTLSSCMRLPQTHPPHSKRFKDLEARPEKDDYRDSTSSPKHSIDSVTTKSQTEEEPEFSYRNLTATNLLLVGLESSKIESNKDEKEDELPSKNYQVTPPRSLVRRLSWNRRKLSFRSLSHPKDTPLLNKGNSEEGGDDIDSDRRYQLIPLHPRPVQDDSNFQASEFASSDRFEIGDWEERKLVSRDGKMELVTKIFLASIDQRSEKAAGESACTVLVAVIADWLHQNPGTLPLKCEFDKLVREGSSEWRNLCENENHRKKFSDQHFDLDTVLKEKIRPLFVVSEKSYIGFFELKDNADHLEYLQGAMSFDDIWEELQSNEGTHEEQIYIVSWNDHFFVLKVEAETIYIIDTLGERLFEGCNKAYILKFNKESRISRVAPKRSTQKVESEGSAEPGENAASTQVDDDSPMEIISEGKASCKEYIKGFLAALPLRELQDDIERGGMKESSLHHRLQIEFHYTAPCT